MRHRRDRGKHHLFPLAFPRNINPQSLLFTLRTIKFMDDWIANPAYVLALFTGAGLVETAATAEGFSYHTPWIVAALVLYALVSVLGLFVYSPLLKKQIKLAESVGPDSAEYKRTDNMSKYLGFVMVFISISITFLMVVKPQLW
jgi:uncharacterized membrane protein